MTTRTLQPSSFVWLLIWVASVSCGNGASETPSNSMMPSATASNPSEVQPAASQPAASQPAASQPPASTGCLNQVDELGNLSLTARPENNYWFTSDFQPEDVLIQPRSELFFDWAELTKDFMGHDMDPLADMNMLLMVQWKIDRATLIQKFNEDANMTEFVKGAVAFYNDGTRTSASLFEFVVPPDGAVTEQQLLDTLDPATSPPDSYSFSIMPSMGQSPGKGIHMIRTMTFDAAGTTQVSVDSTSTSLTYETSLSELAPVHVPVGSANITVDWSEMANNGSPNAMGRPFLTRHINRVLIGHYTETPEQLAENFLDIELPAPGRQLWRANVEAGSKQSLTTLVDDTGAPFTGIDDTGTWVLALQCETNCTNPAPWYLTLLQPCPTP